MLSHLAYRGRSREKFSSFVLLSLNFVENGLFPVVGRKVAQATVLEQLLPRLHRAGDVLRRVGVAAEGDELAAELVVESEPFAVRQGEMAAVGVALDAEPLFDGAAHHMAQLLLVAVEIQLHAA